MQIAVIPHPKTNDWCLEQEQRDRLLGQIASLKEITGNPTSARVGCGQRRLGREISYLVVEEFTNCPTSIYPWLNPENISRPNHKHIEAVLESIRNAETPLMAMVIPQDALPLFVRFFENILNGGIDIYLDAKDGDIILFDTEKKPYFQVIP